MSSILAITMPDRDGSPASSRATTRSARGSRNSVVPTLAQQRGTTDAELDALIRKEDQEIVARMALRDGLVSEQRRRRGLA
jgi:hypothetical protein